MIQPAEEAEGWRKKLYADCPRCGAEAQLMIDREAGQRVCLICHWALTDEEQNAFLMMLAKSIFGSLVVFVVILFAVVWIGSRWF